MCRITLDLAAQVADMHVDCSLNAFAILALQLQQQLGP
jgi:hypothetical protein